MTKILYIFKEILLVSFVFITIKTCGKKELVVKHAAINPIISIFILYFIKKGALKPLFNNFYFKTGQYSLLASIKSSKISFATFALGTVLDIVIACHNF